MLELAPEQSAVDQLRARVADAHAVEQVVADRGSLLRMPLADGVCDALAIADLTPADLTAAQALEIGRVLAPYRGIAILGNARGGLDAGALAAWIKSISTIASISSDGGTWAVVRMPALAGGDDWSHLNHGADGNPVSTDATIERAPDHLQWYRGPYIGDKWGTYVAGAGRVFWSRAAFGDDKYPPHLVIARALNDGHVLWTRPLATNFGRNDSLLIADGETLWLEDDDGVLALNAETGAERSRIAVSAKEKEVRWMLLSDGVLVTLAGPKVDTAFKSAPSRTDSENVNFVGDELAGWDTKSGSRLWSFSEQKIDPPKLVANGGRLFLYANRQYAAALDLRSGKQLWKTAAPIAEPGGKGMGWWWDMNDFFTPTIGAIATKDAYIINWRAHLQSQAFAVADGKLLWDHMHGKEGTSNPDAIKRMNGVGGMLPFWMVLGDTIYTHNNWVYNQPGSGTFDVLTGKSTPKHFSFTYGGCGHFTADSNGLFFGMVGEIFDGATGSMIQREYSKTACGVGQFVADGDIIKVPSPCGSCYEWRGFMVTRTAKDFVAEDPATRLERGPATASAQASDAMDWTTYRATDARSNALPVTMPAKAAVLWTYKPSGLPEQPALDECPTPVIAVGDRAWMGTADGAVVCVGTADGSERWRFATGGRIWSAPSWAQGRIYVGSADGWLYCLGADSGALVWRYRLAPVESRIIQWDRLSSRWPVLPCTLVRDGVAYSLAGVISELDGTEIVALDAATGALRWQKHLGAGQPDASGQMCWGDGAIWLRGGDWGNARLDPSDGKLSLLTSAQGIGHASHGQDICFIGDGWLMYGGRQHILPSANVRQDRMRCTYQLAVPAPSQKDSIITLSNYKNDGVGAWDARGLLFGDESGHWWVDAGLLSDLNANASSPAAAKLAVREAGQSPEAKQRAVELVTHIDKQDRRFSAFFWPMLSANDVIMTGCEHVEWRRYAPYVIAVDRTSGNTVWSVQLPTKLNMPVWNGMCLDRSSHVLVPIQDGSLVCIGAPRG